MVCRLERISLVVKGDMMVVTGLSRLRNVLVVTWECTGGYDVGAGAAWRYDTGYAVAVSTVSAANGRLE